MTGELTLDGTYLQHRSYKWKTVWYVFEHFFSRLGLKLLYVSKLLLVAGSYIHHLNHQIRVKRL